MERLDKSRDSRETSTAYRRLSCAPPNSDAYPENEIGKTDVSITKTYLVVNKYFEAVILVLLQL
jgi:hypothetical protein